MSNRPPIPTLELDDEIDIKSMSKEELDKVPFDIVYWICGVDECTHKSGLRDYGIYPWYYWAGKKEWINVHEVYMYCGHCRKKYPDFFKKKPGAQKPKAINLMMPVKKSDLPGMIKIKMDAVEGSGN